jgi:predicted alpha-1,2-mannosidase
MKMIRSFLLLYLTICSVQRPALAQIANHVDPFLGIDGGGNTIPGPSLPFGMIKPGPDIGDNIANAGWAPTGDINGFSQTHVSGTGGGAKYGNILVQPTTGDVQATGYGSKRDREQGSVGYYRVTLARYPIDVELTSASRAAIYRFTFPPTSHSNILFDVSHCLLAYYPSAEGQKVTSSSIHIISPTGVSGSSSVTGGWNEQPNSYTVYFYAVTDTPAITSGTWQTTNIRPGVKDSESGRGVASGGWLTFGTQRDQQVRLRIGISFVSVDQAKRNLETEIPDFDFDAVHAKAVSAWNKILSTIELTGATPEQQQTFYTALYHTMLMPVDRTGENPLWKSTEPYYDDFYAIWDTFRSSSPLITLIAPERQSQIVRALVDIYRHEGWLPDARSGNYNGRTQGGSNADFLIGDAYVKHLPGIDWPTAYRALVKDAEVSPLDQVKEGRGGLDDWKTLGYLTIEGVDRPGSKQMEYAADDFEIYLVAKGLGDKDEAAKYLKRSSNWKNLWDPQFTDGGFSGFIRPRHRDGTWMEKFTALQGCSWGGDTFYEGNSWTYSTFVPQDVSGLIQLSGGADRFISRLDAFFNVPDRYDVGNEPGFLSPYLYIWARRQDKTAERVRQIIAASFHSGRRGLPGNDDSGAMSSWYAWGMMGIFPNAGQDVYLIGSPQFRSVKIHLAGGKAFIIDAQNESAENKYVVAASLNGQPLDRAWLRHEDIVRGGILTLIMSAKPGTWPSGAVPPSISDSSARLP